MANTVHHAASAEPAAGSLSDQFSLMNTDVTTSKISTQPAQLQLRSTRNMGSAVRQSCQTMPTATLMESLAKSRLGSNDGSVASRRSRTGPQNPQGRVVL